MNYVSIIVTYLSVSKRGYVLGTSKKRSFSARGIAASVLILLLIVQLLLGASAFVFAASQGTVNTTFGLNIRSGAGTNHSIVGSLPYNARVNIVAETTDSSGGKWYQITSTYGNGYVYAEYVSVGQAEESPSGYEIGYSSDADFEAYLADQGFPESYKPYLRELHASYPNWRFIAMHTGLSWEDVIYRETHPVSVSLVPNSWSDAWKSTERAAFDTSTGKYIIFDSGGYVAASHSAVRYYMDPRNNFDVELVFQFLSNKFDSTTQTIDGVKSIAAGTYLETRSPGSGYATYSDLIYDIGKSVGVNPMTIASMLIVEQGRAGESQLISGKCPGYEGYYNFFNVGAYAANGNSAVENGLIYAKKRGWDTPVKAITGGAEIFANNYVYNNKTTLYFKKFNVMNGLYSVGTGQYMTAIYAASTEGRVLSSGYEAVRQVGISFEIPVYLNMPAEPSPLPSSGDNIYYLSSLAVAEGKLSPEFNSYRSEYTLELPDDVKSINISAAAISGQASIAGIGTININDGESSIKVTCTSSAGSVLDYIINIVRVNPGEKPEEKPADVTTPSIGSDIYRVGDSISGVGAGTTGTNVLENMKINNGTAKVFNLNGEEITSATVGTGCIVKVYDGSGAEKASLPILIKGDNNGDGKVNSADALRVMRHSIKTLTLESSQLTASDINGDGKYNSADALLMMRYSIGTYEITW